jgi:ubiquinone/menaquinone biosynthesis C-methylase UbiE
MAKAATSHPIFARVYARGSHFLERELGDHRRTLLDGLTGRVIDVGAGNGLNFSRYPPEVTAVVAVEPEPHLRELAVRAAAKASVPIEVVDGVAERLSAEAASFDAAVVSLMLCSVRDQGTALAEIARVLRPGGQLRFLEHVRSETRGLRRVQRALDATLWPVLMGGCRTHRETATAIEAAGFTIEKIEHLRIPDGRVKLPTSPHILGVARRPW